MPPRRRRQLNQPSPVDQTTLPLSTPSPALSTPVSPVMPRRPPKRRTIADNAREISDMKGQLNLMSELLHSISDRMTPDTAPAMPQPPETDTAASSQQPPIAFDRAHPRAHDRLESAAPTPAYSQPKARHHSTGQFPQPTSTWMHQVRRQDQVRTVDPLGTLSAHHQYRDSTMPAYDSDDNDDLQTRVAHLLTSHLAPMGSAQGKKQFAHFYVRRGSKRAKTTLGELNVPEYNFGFMSLIDSADTFDHDKPHMFRHLANLNEDAAHYEWPGVRFWSEEVCALIAGGKLSWDDEYRIDLLRLKHSQQTRLSAAAKDIHHNDLFREKGIDVQTELPPEVRAAKPGPPCRAFNSGTCPFTHHHVHNGYRRLHICNHCIAQKCLLLPHSVEKCKSKIYTAGPRHVKPKDDPGFGK